MSLNESRVPKTAAQRRADARARKARSRENMRLQGVPSQPQIDAALADAFAWAIRRQLTRKTSARDLVHGGLRVDVTTVVSKAIQRLSGYHPGETDRGGLVRAKVIGARVVDRLAAGRIWWIGRWRVPRSAADLLPPDDDAVVAHGAIMEPDGCDMGGNDDSSRPTVMTAMTTGTPSLPIPSHRGE